MVKSRELFQQSFSGPKQRENKVHLEEQSPWRLLRASFSLSCWRWIGEGEGEGTGADATVCFWVDDEAFLLLCEGGVEVEMGAMVDEEGEEWI